MTTEAKIKIGKETSSSFQFIQWWSKTRRLTHPVFNSSPIFPTKAGNELLQIQLAICICCYAT